MLFHLRRSLSKSGRAPAQVLDVKDVLAVEDGRGGIAAPGDVRARSGRTTGLSSVASEPFA